MHIIHRCDKNSLNGKDIQTNVSLAVAALGFPESEGNVDSMNVGKVVNLESMVSSHCTTVLGHVTIMRTSYFDTDFVSQMKLTTLPLIHCFDAFRKKIRPPMPDISTYPAAKSKGLMTDPFLQKARNPIQMVSMLTARATSKQSKNPITNTQGRASRKPKKMCLCTKISHPVVDSGFLRVDRAPKP